MAQLNFKIDVHAFLDEEGVGVSIYFGEDDDEGVSTVISFSDLIDDIVDNCVVDGRIRNKEDKKYVEAVAKQLADMSKDLFCYVT